MSFGRAFGQTIFTPDKSFSLKRVHSHPFLYSVVAGHAYHDFASGIPVRRCASRDRDAAIYTAIISSDLMSFISLRFS